MKNIVIGASGFLGHYLVAQLGINTVATYANNEPLKGKKLGNWVKLNIANFQEVETFIDEHNLRNEPANIFFLAACHHPDFVEENAQFAWNINITSLANFTGQICSKSNFYYASTDNVYGESLHFSKFTEYATRQPVNTYGKQKKLAEDIVLSAGFNVVRFPFLVGPSMCDKNHFFDVIMSELKRGEHVELLCDSYRSTLSFKQAAKLLSELASKFNSEYLGFVNIASDEVLSKYDVGIKMCEIYHIPSGALTPIYMSNQSFFKAKRPKNVLINNGKLKSLLGLNEIKLEF